MQKLTPNDSVCWEIPADVPFGVLPTYIKIHLFRYEIPLPKRPVWLCILCGIITVSFTGRESHLNLLWWQSCYLAHVALPKWVLSVTVAGNNLLACPHGSRAWTMLTIKFCAS